jgi:hypothetical protein
VSERRVRPERPERKWVHESSFRKQQVLERQCQQRMRKELRRKAKRIADQEPIATVHLAEFLSAARNRIDVDSVTGYKHAVGCTESAFDC